METFIEEMEAGSSLKKLIDHVDTKDFISDLPDPILVHILSFLPIREAIETVLLKRFGNLWRSIPVLQLDECMYHDCENKKASDYEMFTNIIHHVSNLHGSSVLDKLRLKFRFALSSSNKGAFFYNPYSPSYAREKATARDLDKLIGYAINRKVKVLDLDFGSCSIVLPSEFYKLPDVFRSDYITDLRLDTCDITLFVNINLKALKVLSLHRILSLNDEVMEKILLGSPNLEDLSVCECYSLGRVYCKNPNLKKLMIILNMWEPTKLFLYCPYVLSLTLEGWIEQATLLNASSLIDASVLFHYHFTCENKAYVEVQRLLQEVCRCTDFSTDKWTILVMTVWNLRDVPYSSFQWKNVTIKFCKLKWYYLGVYWLLRSSHSIEKLTMYVMYPGCVDFFEESNWIWAHDFDEMNYWDLQDATFPKLESITIRGCINDPSVIQMMKFLLRSATQLKKILLEFMPKAFTEEENEQQLLELEQKLLSFPRASSQALMVYFL